MTKEKKKGEGGREFENSDESLHKVWDTIKENNLHIIGVPEGE